MSEGSLVNPYVLIPVVCWLVAQLLKIGFSSKKGKINPRVLIESGGMPSSHTAIVTGLALTILIRDGADSPLFGISLVLALIVIYDALNVRRAVGEYGRALNEIRTELSRRDNRGVELLDGPKGHKPTEVLAGILVGAVVTIVLQFGLFKDTYPSLFVAPNSTEIRTYALILMAVLALGIAVVMYLANKEYGKMPTARKHLQRIKLLLIGFPLMGSLLLIAQYLELNILSERIWMYVLGVVFLYTLVQSLITMVPGFKEALESEREQLENDKKKSKLIAKKRRKNKKRKH